MKRKPDASHRLCVPRSVKSLEDDGAPVRALAEWRDVDAYVLLGDPGSGKSESLRQEAEATSGVYVSASDFIALRIPATDAGKTIFIDGLDEMRAGSTAGQVPLNQIRSKLEDYGRPCFRLSCREHDWRSQSDLEALRRVAPTGVVHELHLEPLTRDEQLAILRNRSKEIPDAEAFLQETDKLGLGTLFGNPLLLDLTIQAYCKGGRPKTRAAVYELACRELATERSDVHLSVKPLAPGSLDRILFDAGLACAVLLLSGKTSFTRKQEAEGSAIPWHTLPAALQMHDPTEALASKVFAGAGDSVAAPRHRSIAEFLAAKAIARLLHEGLPLGRVLALMKGGDGGIVEPLRGLLGWLTVHHIGNRHHLIRLDPLATVLNGDIAEFSTADKRVLLESLRDAAERNHWFRSQQWVSYPFAPLASPDMGDALSAVLENHSPDPSHQALVDCVLDALLHGTPIPTLAPVLESWVEDAQAWFSNRTGALAALKRADALEKTKALSWLDQLHDGRLQDQDARLAALLLAEMYPTTIGPEDVLRYWPKPGQVGANTIIPHFWYSVLLKQTRPQDYALLADAWLCFRPQSRQQRDSDVSRLRAGILAGALEHSGEQVSDERLEAWLHIAVDKYGHSRIDRDALGEAVVKWLTDRPDRQKAVLVRAWHSTMPEVKSGRRHFWSSEQLLHGSRRPPDWLHWLLRQAAEAPNEELAQFCFSQVAHAVVEPLPGYDVPTMDQVGAWAETYAERWPRARDWLVAMWSSQIEDNWQGDEHRRKRQREAECHAKRAERRKAIEPHLGSAMAGRASASLMHQIADAYDENFYEIRGGTPAERVQDFLVSDHDTARAVIAGIERVLDREDLPSAEEIFALHAKGKYHSIRPAALLAARLVYERSPDVVQTWAQPLLATLVAFWLTEGAGEAPGWYTQAVASRQAEVAPLFVHQAKRSLCRKKEFVTVGLWALANEPGYGALARLVVPQLLEAFPQRAGEPARRELSCSLLPALRRLDAETASAIVFRKLALPSMDLAQRICWLVADLSYSADAALRLADVVGTSQRRAVALGVALHEQRILGRDLKRLSAATLSGLIALLGPITKSSRDAGVHFVGPADDRADTVRALIHALAADPSPDAAVELERLAALPGLSNWRTQLRHSLLSQQATAREASYVPPSPASAAITLANQAPANRADLAALTADHLREIERHLRGRDTFAVRHFWHTSDKGAPSPKSENDCRDMLLERLGPRLERHDVALVPERRAADEKRSDLRAEYMAAGRLLAVPIEIKKESNDTLWIAWRDQLQALYTIDPSADGHGIYLALWFGHKPRRSPDGDKPNSAQDLERMLLERIPAKDRARIAVVALDLSLPTRRPGRQAEV